MVTVTSESWAAIKQVLVVAANLDTSLQPHPPQYRWFIFAALRAASTPDRTAAILSLQSLAFLGT